MRGRVRSLELEINWGQVLGSRDESWVRVEIGEGVESGEGVDLGVGVEIGLGVEYVGGVK